MVVTCLPTAALTGVTQERTALPSMCTVQAPHRAIPQPYLVPVRPTCSRIAHNRGVLGSTLTSLAFPLIVRRAIGSPSPRVRCRKYPLSGSGRQAISASEGPSQGAHRVPVNPRWPRGEYGMLLVMPPSRRPRSEEHTSELQSPCNLVCRLLLEKKKYKRLNH